MSLTDRIRSLSPEQRALLEEKLRAKDHVPKRDVSSPPPLSFAQQRMWFLDQLEPDNIAYNSPVALRLTGTLNIELLEKTLNHLLARHVTLRSRFPDSGGQPALEYADHSELPLRKVDLSHLTSEERMAAARRLAREEMRIPFDLQTGPILRASLYHLDARLHLLTIAAHHIATDGWSIGVLVREFSEIYAALLQGDSPNLPKLSIDYADYAAWQRSWLTGARLETQLNFWRTQLDGAIPALEIPTDRPRPAVQSFKGGRESRIIHHATSAAAHELARSMNGTLFMVLLATLKTLVHRYTRETDILIGAPIANRRRREIENLVGYIANTLVLRSDLTGDPGFRELLGRVRNTALAAFEHQDIPFEKLVEELPTPRETNRTPFFGIALTLQNAPISASAIPGLELDVLRVDNGTAKFDLSLVAVETSAGLQLTAEYSSDLYNPSTIRRFLGHFEVLLTHAIATPEQKISELPILTEEESHTLCSLPPVSEFPVECLHRGFEKQVRQHPDAIALVDGARRMTYAELNAHANGLAKRLLDAGVGSESMVALLLDRSAAQIIAILAVLKAGGAYVPLDVGNPSQRLKLILDDSRAKVVITSRKDQQHLPGTAAAVIKIEEVTPSDINPDQAVTPANLAYVMYTSGSTGVPKGVMIEHRQVSRMFSSVQHEFAFGPDLVSTVFHSYAFDLSVWEIFSALLHGGRVVSVPFLTSRSPHAFLELLESEDVTMILQTPSAFRGLQVIDDGRPLALRHIIFGGEMLPMSLLRNWIHRRGDERPALINMYGPTETTVLMTHRRIREDDLKGGSMIGIAFPDSRCIVLDQHRKPVPIGMPGELHVGGPCVARGYLRRPEKQAEVFLHDLPPWPGVWYKTGDVVRLRENGDIEFLGREDAQLKLRGFRIEKGEIEAAICQLPDFSNAVALVFDDQLVAYCVTRTNPSDIDQERLGKHLAEYLPSYMIPSSFVFLEELPQTINGKLDHSALPAPGATSALPNHNYIAPRTADEKVAVEIWSEILQRDRVGLEDDFFRIGGHSLLAAVVMNRMEKALNRQIPLRLLFETPTISGILQSAAGAAPMQGDEPIEEGRL
ncbi:non-ribosomal peptide synthetase [Haloferula sp.]|uniref:non-ribosomal peptide synthetase n=1 Tax=Haloferula sp. TaxID=2497595 RepID=UPI003C72FB44